ncbi:hypothetical protein JX266_002105 [Neoarthrinium moseri]|nr:hypothetical protein JX266_002105 [Neoarthrinium moseri]
MAGGGSIFLGAVIVAAMCVAAWFLAPKGENQTSRAEAEPQVAFWTEMQMMERHCMPPIRCMPSFRSATLQTRNNSEITNGLVKIRSTWRSSLIIAFISCYLMWFITFMAQLHPLIAPKNPSVRSGYQHE